MTDIRKENAPAAPEALKIDLQAHDTAVTAETQELFDPKECMLKNGITPPDQEISSVRFTRWSADGCDYSAKMLAPDVCFVQNFNTGFKTCFRSDGWIKLTAEEKAEKKLRMEQKQKKAESDLLRIQERVAQKAEYLWRLLPAADDRHAYLLKKGVSSHGLKLTKDNRLVVPLIDMSGRIQNLQFIDENGGKRFMNGGRQKGCYCMIGKAEDKIFLCEGYATAANIRAASGAAVAIAFNAGNMLPVAEMIMLKYPKRQIIVAADNDRFKNINTGLNAARAISEKLGIPYVLPEFKDDKGEPTDFNDLFSREGAEAVKACLGKPVLPAQRKRFLISCSIEELLNMDIKDRDYVMEPIIPEQGLAMIYAERGIGKTFVGLAIACAVAMGTPLFRWNAPKPRKVLYLDGEMPAKVMQERLAKIILGIKDKPESFNPEYLKVITPDIQHNPMPNLSSEDAQRLVEPHLKDTELVIIDNISTLCSFGKENEAESWSPIQTWLLDLRRRGISVLLIHHAGKGGKQRGTSRREDILDTVISLKRPDDYSSDQGARFEVHFDKARGFYGSDADPFEATLEEENHYLVWHFDGLKNAETDLIKSLSDEGKSAREIEKETGISKSKVNRIQNKLKLEIDL